MSSENDGTFSDDVPDHIREMWQEFFDKNPHATHEEQWHQLVNYLGPSEPILLLEETNEPSLQRDGSPQFEAYRFGCSPESVGELARDCVTAQLDFLRDGRAEE